MPKILIYEYWSLGTSPNSRGYRGAYKFPKPTDRDEFSACKVVFSYYGEVRLGRLLIFALLG